MSRSSVKNESRELRELRDAVTFKANKLKEFNSEYVPKNLKEILNVSLPFVVDNEDNKKQHLILLLAILSLIPNIYKKRLISLYKMCLRLEEDGITSVYKTTNKKHNTDNTQKTHVPMDLNYAILTKEYLKQIKDKYGVNTQDFTFLYPEEKVKSYDVNYLSNTHIFSMIDSILKNSDINSNSSPDTKKKKL